MGYEKKRVDGIPPKPNKQRITLRQATDYTQRFRRVAPASEHAGFFWAEGVRAVLAQPGCSGVRIYHGLSKDGRYRMVIVGVDASGEDITRSAVSTRPAARSAKAASGDAVILDTHWPCPPFCPPGSPL